MANLMGHFEDANGNILLPIPSGATATIETSNSASQAYTTGSFLFYNNRLCRVISAIAKGNTLVVGSNLAYTSLGAQTTSHLVTNNGIEFSFQNYLDGNYS